MRRRVQGYSGAISAGKSPRSRPMPLSLPPPPPRRSFLGRAGSRAAVAALAMSPVAGLAQTGPAGQPLKIATIGAGREGSALGSLFVKADHPVMFSSRHPEELKDLV